MCMASSQCAPDSHSVTFFMFEMCAHVCQLTLATVVRISLQANATLPKNDQTPAYPYSFPHRSVDGRQATRSSARFINALDN